MVFSSSGTAEVKRISGNEIYLQVDSVTKTEGPKGQVEKKNSYEMKITFSGGSYSTGEGYIHSGSPDSDGKVLNMQGEQSGITFKVSQ